LRLHIFPHVANFVVGLESVNQFIFPLISQIGINYRNRSLSCDAGGDLNARAGDRMPYFLVGDESIYDRLHQPKFHLLTFTDEPIAHQTTKAEVESEYAGLVDYHVFPLQPRAAEVFGTDKPFNILLRPDNYIAFVAPDASSRGLGEYFKNAIGRVNEARAMKAEN